MNIAKHTILTLLVLATALFTACSDEDAVTMPGTDAPNAPGLHIALSLGGKQPVYAAKQTRANTIEGENSLNENTVETVDFFLFNPVVGEDGTISWTYKQQWHFPESGESITQTTGANDSNDQTTSPDYYPTQYFTLKQGSDWRTTLGIVQADGATITAGSRLYAIANLPSTVSTSDINTWDKFCALAVTDTLIQRKYSNSTTLDNSSVEAYKNQLQAGKHFLMDGYYEFTTTKDATDNASPVHQVTVDLRRAAAKVRVNIYKATSWTGENGADITITPSDIIAKVSNYATTTKVVTPEDGESLGDNGHVSTYANLGTYNRELTAPSGKAYLTSVLFYTFAHDWSADIGHETTFIMNLPYEGRLNNWYKIVFVPDGGQRYNRNTFYEVDVTVAYDGSEDSYEPSPISNPKYKVSEWYPEEFSVENTTPVDYLILDKYFIDMRNVAETQITFYSSNKVTVEVVHDVADEIASLGGKDKFPWPEGFDYDDYIGEPADETVLDGITVADIPGIYYPDKESRRVPIYYAGTGYDNNTNNSSDPTYNTTGYTFRDLNKAKYLPVTVVAKEDATSYASKEESEVYITWPGNKFAESGEKIDVYSAIPRNVTLRFITLKVKMEKAYDPGKYITRYVIIKQYPLEYIVNQFGYYSFMDDNILSRDDVESIYTYASTFEYNDATGTGVNNATGLYKVYCGDLEDGKDKWVTIPKEITEGLLVSSNKTYTKFDGSASNYALSGHIGQGVAMKCKFYLDGTANTYNNFSATTKNQHYWTDAEGGHYGIIYQVDDSYGDTDEEEGTTGTIGDFPTLTDENNNQYNYKVIGGIRRYNSNFTTPEKIDNNDAGISNLVGLDANTPSNNNRMYEVRITATSSKYRIGYPKTAIWAPTPGKAQLYADDSWDNSQLVSPHFVIASQLGNTSATPYWEMAHDHCMHYVEVDNKGNVFEDWRLPTIAELKIIKQYQLDDDVFNVTMNRILNSDGDTQPQYWSSAKYWYVDTTGAGKEEYQSFNENTKRVVAGLYKDSDTREPVWDKSGTGKYRVRCVRDIISEKTE